LKDSAPLSLEYMAAQEPPGLKIIGYPSPVAGGLRLQLCDSTLIRAAGAFAGAPAFTRTRRRP